MWLHTLKLLPLQLGGAGVLVFATAAAGGYFLTHPAPGSQKKAAVPPARTLPFPTQKEDAAAPLRQELAGLATAQQQAVQKLAALRDEGTKLTQDKDKQKLALKQKQELAGTPVAEEQQLQTRLQNPPQWQTLGLEEPAVSQLKSAWESLPSEKLQAEENALALLTERRQKLLQEAGEKQTQAQAVLGQRRSFLVALKTDVQKARTDLVSSLDLSLLKDDEVSALKKAIQDLMQGSLRIVLGKNFTNSAGVEMVWVPFKESGFWIGRSEVAMPSFAKISPGDSGNCSADGDGYVYRVLWREADQFCRRLSEKEKSGQVPDEGQLGPQGWGYALPSTGHLNFARKAGLGLLNLQSGGAEWVTNPSTMGGFRSLWQKNGGDGSLLAVPDNRDHVVVSDSGANKGIRRDYYDGKVGFRVILVPDENR